MCEKEEFVYPRKQDSTQKLRSILLGTILYVKWEDVSVIKIPQYKGLQFKGLLRFAEHKISIYKYLPDYYYNKQLNREWLCNLLNSLIAKYFQAFIKEKVEIRKNELIESQNLGIHAKPEFISIFKKITSSINYAREILFFSKNAKDHKS